MSQRVTQQGDYGFARGGRVDMTLDSYSLNEEELHLVEQELAKKDVTNSMKFSMDIAESALEEMKEDLDKYLRGEDDLKEEEKKNKKKDDVNPFSAIMELFRPSKKKKGEKISDVKNLKKDNYVEKLTRAEAAKTANEWLFTVYDIYKKAHGMESSPMDFENADSNLIEEPDAELADAVLGRGKQGK